MARSRRLTLTWFKLDRNISIHITGELGVGQASGFDDPEIQRKHKKNKQVLSVCKLLANMAWTWTHKAL